MTFSDILAEISEQTGGDVSKEAEKEGGRKRKRERERKRDEGERGREGERGSEADAFVHPIEGADDMEDVEEVGTEKEKSEGGRESMGGGVTLTGEGEGRRLRDRTKSRKPSRWEDVQETEVSVVPGSCVCGKRRVGSLLVGCGECGAWSHMDCMGFTAIAEVPPHWRCLACQEKGPAKSRGGRRSLRNVARFMREGTGERVRREKEGGRGEGEGEKEREGGGREDRVGEKERERESGGRRRSARRRGGEGSMSLGSATLTLSPPPAKRTRLSMKNEVCEQNWMDVVCVYVVLFMSIHV